MKELVEIIVKALVDAPDQVVITEETQNDEQVISIKVAAEDMGKVIGKGGRRAQAIRSIMKAKYLRDGRRVIVDIVG